MAKGKLHQQGGERQASFGARPPRRELTCCRSALTSRIPTVVPVSVDGTRFARTKKSRPCVSSRRGECGRNRTAAGRTGASTVRRLMEATCGRSETARSADLLGDSIEPAMLWSTTIQPRGGWWTRSVLALLTSRRFARHSRLKPAAESVPRFQCFLRTQQVQWCPRTV